MDAQSRIPKVTAPLEFQDGQAFLMKTDILKETMYFSYDQTSYANLYPLPASEVKEIMRMNSNGQRPESLKGEPVQNVPEFISAVGDDSITRFDEARKKRKGGRGKNRQNQPSKGQKSRPGDRKQFQKDRQQERGQTRQPARSRAADTKPSARKTPDGQ